MSRVISREILDKLSLEARNSPRRRQHQNLHSSYSDPCQRLLNAVSPGSYIRPHRHSLDPKVETLIAIRGLFGVIIFDEGGQVVRTERIGVECGGSCSGPAMEIAPDAWHTAISLTEDAVLLEVKAGPFDPHAAKEMAEWAPAEGTQAAAQLLQQLSARFACLPQAC